MSFSYDTKLELLDAPLKFPCCRRALATGLLFGRLSLDADNVTVYYDDIRFAEFSQKLIKEQYGRDTEIIEKSKKFSITFSSRTALERIEKSRECFPPRSVLRCENCIGAFMRGLFISGGTISKPEAECYLEIKTDLDADLFSLRGLLTDKGINIKVRRRGGKNSLYMKNSGEIEDFLVLIGATARAFDLMNGKIVKELRNNANRAANCDANNIARSLDAAKIQLDAISYLIKKGRISELSPELSAAADARIGNPELPLSKLGAMMTPAVTKSGINHRLNKIVEIAEEYRRAEEKSKKKK